MSNSIDPELQKDIDRIFDLSSHILPNKAAKENTAKPAAGEPKKDNNYFRPLEDFIPESGAEKTVAVASEPQQEPPKEGLGEGKLGLTNRMQRNDVVALREDPARELGIIEKVSHDIKGLSRYYVKHSDKNLAEMFRHRWYDEGALMLLGENVLSPPKTFDVEHVTDDWAGGINGPKTHRRFRAPGDNPLAAEQQAHGDNAKTKVVKQDAVKPPSVKESVNVKGDMVSKEEFLKYMA